MVLVDLKIGELRVKEKKNNIRVKIPQVYI